MKKLLFLLFFIASLSVFAQKDSYLTVTYKGYNNGHYIIQVDNNQSACSNNVDVAVFIQGVSITNVSGNGVGNGSTITILHLTQASTTIYFTGPFVPNPKFIFTDLTMCNWQGKLPSPITANMNPTLPVKFTRSPEITAVYEDYVTVSFTVEEQADIKQYNVQFSRDNGKTWNTISVIPADNSVMGKTYSVNVQINK